MAFATLNITVFAASQTAFAESQTAFAIPQTPFAAPQAPFAMPQTLFAMTQTPFAKTGEVEHKKALLSRWSFSAKDSANKPDLIHMDSIENMFSIHRRKKRNSSLKFDCDSAGAKKQYARDFKRFGFSILN